MEDLVGRTVGPHIEIKFTKENDLWQTIVDPNQIENALLKLCINARRDAGQGRVDAPDIQPRIRTACRQGPRSHSGAVSLCVIAAILCLRVVALTFMLKVTDRAAFWCLAPYLLWLACATGLNGAIFMLN